MTTTRKGILVLCTGNSARSILGEAMLARLGGDRVQAYSAGSKPKGSPHPAALRLLARRGIDATPFSSSGTSRNALAMIRNAGIEPHVIEYLKTPPSRALLASLIERAGMTPRALLREKGTPYGALGLDNPSLDDDALIDAMMEHPILINRPLVVSPLGVKLCRPSEVVLDLLPQGQKGAFAKEDGELVVDEAGNRVA